MNYLISMAETALSKNATKTMKFDNGPLISVTTFGDENSANISANGGVKYSTSGANNLVSKIKEVLSACQKLDDFDFEYSDNDVEWLLSLFED
ncbi:hypothetical protein [Desulfovibrio intestinalis]|uniref:Uncharacterized protein n=1 Tax=Desulfovibrio intestinalis TaxID=58621 RepID=A0A7W8C0B0_9BACT|nr:hypothetical protein [Desulfovibrio intestinalis]MBB5142528.1 hypothetical protein [Desulfovibrio intestinalis]